MTTICQDAATLTRTTVRTTSTVYLSTSIQQVAGRPTTSNVAVPSTSCNTAGTGSSATVRCATYTSSMATVVTPAPSQVQVIMTVTNQVVQTQVNTLFGTLCRTEPLPGVTDTTYTTEYVTVSGTDPSTPPPPSTTTFGSSRTSISQSTVFGSPGDPTSESDPSGTADGASSSQSGSSNVPVGAIAGGVVGGIVVAALLGFLIYYLLSKKAAAAKGYKAPGEELAPSAYEHSDVFSSEQTGYYSQGYDGQGQASSQPYGQTQFQGSYPTQYADGQGAHYSQPQGGAHMYAEPQGAQYASPDMGQILFNGASSGFSAAAGVAIPVVAAASLTHSRQYSSSSSPPPTSYSPQSQLSTVPLIHQGSQQQGMSHTVTPVPYRGYAEPGDG